LVHFYRDRYGAAEGDPAFEHIEAELAKQPVITVPTIVLHGEADGVSPPQSSKRHNRCFTSQDQRRVMPDRRTFPAARESGGGGASGSRVCLGESGWMPHRALLVRWIVLNDSREEVIN
jgi:hypothetical protein